MRAKKIIQKNTFLLIILILLLNVLAMTFYWYSSIWWFDMGMHFLGGFWLALFAVALFFRYAKQTIEEKHRARIVISILFFVLGVALLWEAYEFGVQSLFSVRSLASPIDSLSDLAWGVSGGIFGIAYILRVIGRSYE